jgi:hypothetical protein
MQRDTIVYTLVFAVVSLVTILPLVLFPMAGDWIEQAAYIQCFGDQFWQGNFYPRWCMGANDGLGAPFFLFYFPLPFYISSLLYPLTWLGVGVYPLFILCCFLATMVTALTSYIWLRDIVSSKFAVLATILLLLVPYRMELLLYRFAYSELWAVALTPLLFAAVRKLALGELHQWRKLAWICGAMILCHLPAFVAAAIGGGIYMLVMARGKMALLLRYGYATGCGVLLSAFFIVPAWYYTRYILGERVMAQSWSIGFLTWSHQFGPLTLMLFLSIFVLVAIAVWLYIKRTRIDDHTVQREIVAWCAILAVCIFLVFPVSHFFYALIGALDQVVHPRRMQSLLIPCAGYFTAIILQYFASKRKNWHVDYAVLTAFMMLAAYGITGVPAFDSGALLSRIVQVQGAIYAPFQPHWADDAHWSMEYVLKHAEHKPPKVTVIQGKGDVNVEHWQWDGIILSVRSADPVRLKLDHMYFPVWQAAPDDNVPITLSPEPGSSLMLLNIPAGDHHVLLRPSVFAEEPLLMRFSCAVSMLTMLALIGMGIRRRPYSML